MHALPMPQPALSDTMFTQQSKRWQKQVCVLVQLKAWQVQVIT